MKHVLHTGTGTFFPISDAVIFDDDDLSDVELAELSDSGEIPESVKGVSLVTLLERLA